MIVYDLRCENGHTFEGWFKDSQSFEDQNSRKLVICPVCGSYKNQILPSSVMYVGRESRSLHNRTSEEISLQTACEIVKNFVDEHCEDVGERFTEVAVKIHRGVEEERNIRGTATQNEEDYLTAEGIPFQKIPSLKFNS